MILSMPQTPSHLAIGILGSRLALAAKRLQRWCATAAISAVLAAAPAIAQTPAGGGVFPSSPASAPQTAENGASVPVSQAPGTTPAGAAALQPDKGRARKAFETGRRAEQSGDWNAEFAAYTEAASYDPSNREYSVLKEHARFQVVQSLVQSAERQEIAGDAPGARSLLSQALQIDPNYVVARERLDELTPSVPEAEAQNAPRLAGLPRLALKPGKHAFDYRGTVRGAYGEIANQFAVKVVFDGDLPDRAVRFQVPELDFDTAVMILARQTKTFTRVVDAHTLFVTEDTAQKERDYALEVSKQIQLPASVGSDEMNEVVRIVREMTGITRTQLNTATRTLTVRSTEQNVALAEALLKQLEQPRGELMLEIQILEIDRTSATQLGVTPPSASSLFMLTLPEVRQLQAAQQNGTLISTLQSIFGNSAVSSATGAALPALIAFGGGSTIFFATMPGASANFGAALSTVQSAQRVLLRAQDGKPATFFVGDRYPVSLGLLSSDLSPTASGLAAAISSGLTSGLTLPSNTYNVGQSPISVAIADFNGDGKPDIAVANSADGTITLLEGNGDGTFNVPSSTLSDCTETPTTFPSCIKLPPVSPGGTTSPSAIVTGAFVHGATNATTGATIEDIAVTDQVNNRVLVLIGNGDGTFQTAVPYPTGTAPVALVAEDFDGDGDPDLAVVDQGDGKTAGAVSVLLGKFTNGVQDGTFGANTDYPVGFEPSAIATGTFVTNGFTSLAVTNKVDNTVSILLGQGTGTTPDGTFKLPGAPLSPTYATGAGPAGVAVGDFNNDAKPDLAVTYPKDSSGNSVSILLGNGDGSFGTAKNFPAGTNPMGILAAAFAGSNIDLAAADQAENNVDVLIGNGDGTFATPITVPTGNSPVALATGDDGSGTAILVSANSTSNTVTVTLDSIQSLANSPSAQTAYPSAEYQDLGLKMKATPHLHANDEVTLQLEFDIKSLSGANINGIPILSNRNIEQTIRLRENETSVLSGILQSNELRPVSGLPWTSTVPGIGLLTGEEAPNIQQTELLILVTPRALRLPPRAAPAIYAGRGEPSTPPSAPAAAPGVPQPGPAGAQNPLQQREGERGGVFGGGNPPNQGPGAVVTPQAPGQPSQDQPQQPQQPRAPPQQQ
jgi:type II secretory pathway component GspD/PulD (secretin)